MSDLDNHGKVQTSVHGHRLPVHLAPSYGTSEHHATQKKSPIVTMNTRKESRGRLETPRGDIPIPSYLTHIASPSPMDSRRPGKTISFASDPRVGTKDPGRVSWEESLLSADPVNPWLAKFQKYSKNPEDVSLSLQCSTVTSVGLPVSPKTGAEHDQSVQDVGNFTNKNRESPKMRGRVLLRQSTPTVHSQPSASAASLGRGVMPSYIKDNVTTSLLNLNDSTTIEALIERERRNHKETQRRHVSSTGSAARAVGSSDSGVELQSKTISQSEKEFNNSEKDGATVVENTCNPKTSEESTRRVFNPAADEKCHSKEPEKSRGINEELTMKDDSLSIGTDENQSRKRSSRRRSPSKHNAQKKGPISNHRNLEQSSVAVAESRAAVKVKSSTMGSSNEKKSHRGRHSCKKHSRKEHSSHERDVDVEGKDGSKRLSAKKCHKDSGSEEETDKHKQHSTSRKVSRTVHRNAISNDPMRPVDSKDAPHDEEIKQRHKHSDHRLEICTRQSKDENGEQAKHSSNGNGKGDSLVMKVTPKSGGSLQLNKETSDTHVKLKETGNLAKQRIKDCECDVAVSSVRSTSTSVSSSNKDYTRGREPSNKDNTSKDKTSGSTSEPISETVMNKSHKTGPNSARAPDQNVKTSQHVSRSDGTDKNRDRNVLSLTSNTLFETPSQPEGVAVIPTEKSQALINGATYNLTGLDPRLEAALKNGQNIRIAGPYLSSEVAAVATEGTGTLSSAVNCQNARAGVPKTSLGLSGTAVTAQSGITSLGYAAKFGKSVQSASLREKPIVMDVRIPTPPFAQVGPRCNQPARSYLRRLLPKSDTSHQTEGTASPAQTAQLHTSMAKPRADADSLASTSNTLNPLLPEQNLTHEVLQIHCQNSKENEAPPKTVTSEFRGGDPNLASVSQTTNPVSGPLNPGATSSIYRRLPYFSKGEAGRLSGPVSSTTPCDRSKQLHVDAPLVPGTRDSQPIGHSCVTDCNKQEGAQSHHQRDGDSTSSLGSEYTTAENSGPTISVQQHCRTAMPSTRNIDDILKMPLLFERQFADILLTVFHDVDEKRIVFVRDRCKVVKDVPRGTTEVRIDETNETFVFKFEPVASTPSSANLETGPNVGDGDQVASDRISEVDKVLKDNETSNKGSEQTVDEMAKCREAEHTKKKKKSKRKKTLESKGVHVHDLTNSDSWQSIPGTEPLVVKLRKDVRTGEEIPGSEGKIADVSMYSVVKPGKDEKTEDVESHRPRFEHRKITMRLNGNSTEFVWDHDKENVALGITPVLENPDQGTDASRAKVHADITPQSRGSEDDDQEGFQDLLPWELKHLNELSPNASEQDQDDGLIYESIGCDDIGMEWSPESCDNDREILESRSDIDIFVPEPYCDLFVQGKNIFKGGSEDRKSPDRSLVTKEKPSPYSLDNDEEASWQECQGEEEVPYEEISGVVVDDLLVEGQAIFPTRVTWNQDEDGEGGIPDECFEEDMIKGDTFLGSSRDWTKNLEPEVIGLAVEVPSDGFPPLASESFGFSCEKSQDPSVYDDFYESDYRNDTENVDSGHGSLQVLGVGLNPQTGSGNIEQSFLDDVRQLGKVLNDMSSEADGDNHLMRIVNASFQGDFKQKIGQIIALMKAVKPAQFDDPRFKLGADIIKHLTNILSAQRGLLKVANITSSTNSIPAASMDSSQCSKAFHSIAYGSIISNISFVGVSADQILNVLALMKTEGDSALFSENMTSFDGQVPPSLAQVASVEALNTDVGMRAPPSPTQKPQSVRDSSLKLTPSSVFIDSIDNSVDNKRKRLVLSSDSSDSSISQSNISKCLSVSMEMHKKTPSDGKVRHQKKRVCQVDVIPSRSADWRSELLEKGAMTSTPVKQAMPCKDRQHMEVLPSVQEEAQFPKKNGAERQYSQSASAQYPLVHKYQSVTPTKLNCSNAIYPPRRVVGETSLCPSLPNTSSSGNTPQRPSVSTNRVLSEVQQTEVKLTKKSLMIESGTGAYGEWTFRLTSDSRPKQKNVGTLGFDSPSENIRNAASCGVEVGRGSTLFNKMLKGEPQQSSVAALMKGKRWWFFDNTGQAKQPRETMEIIYGHCFSPDSHAVIVYCKTRDGKKYRRLATRDEMMGLQKPDWEMTGGLLTANKGTCSEGERELAVSKRVFNSGRAGVPVGHCGTPTGMDNSGAVQEGLSDKKSCREKDNGVTRVRVDNPDRKKSAEAVSYVVTDLLAGEEAKRSRSGEGSRRYSPSQRLNSRNGSPFEVEGGHVRYKSPPKRRRSSSTSSCPEGTCRDLRKSPFAKSCDLNGNDDGHSNVKRNLSSSFEEAPGSEQDTSGSPEEDPPYHRKAKKEKRPSEGMMNNAYDLTWSPTRKHRDAKEVDKRNSKTTNSPTRKSTKGKPVHDLQDIRSISPPRRSKRCSGWKVNSLSPEKITPGKRRGFPYTAPCTKILNELWNMSESDPFASDRKKKHEQLPPDYYKIVKRPMWLEWIARKLADRAYGHLREFVHDVKRIFWNCYLYNKSGKILEDCRVLEEAFSNLMMEYFPEEYDDLIGLTGNPDECRRDSDHTVDEQEEIPISQTPAVC